MANLEGQKAPAFTLAGERRQKAFAFRLRRKKRHSLVLSQGRYTRLNQRSVRVPRR